MSGGDIGFYEKVSSDETSVRARVYSCRKDLKMTWALAPVASILRQPAIPQPHGNFDRRYGLSVRAGRAFDFLPLVCLRFRRIQHHLPVVIALRIECEIARAALRCPSLGQFHPDRNILCRVRMVMQL